MMREISDAPLIRFLSPTMLQSQAVTNAMLLGLHHFLSHQASQRLINSKISFLRRHPLQQT
jgi:hypothetical protein